MKNKESKKTNKEARRIVFILVCIIIMFLTLIVYLTFFQIFRADTVKDNNYNKRLWLAEEKILRGKFLDRNGLELAGSVREDDSTRRYYNYGSLYSHVIGYSYREYGKSGLENSLNNTLLGIDDKSTIKEIKDLIKDEKFGNDIKLTIDHGLQEKSQKLLKGQKGSIITMNPSTGEIYSMVSYPDFDAGNLREEWSNIVIDNTGPLLNRGTQGLYEPGSTFKTLVAAGILKNENNLKIDRKFNCEGSIIVDGYKFSDYSKKAHGPLELEEALAKSCNSYFVKKTSELGADALGEISEDFYINKSIPFELKTAESKFDYKNNIGKTELAASGIGQGKVLMTPLNMLLISSTIANDGEMLRPSLVKEVINSDGRVIKSLTKESLGRPLDENMARELKNMMGAVVSRGTGKKARVAGVEVGGKTGTAENSSGKSHAWFTGFAPIESPKIAVVVLLEENGTTGGSTAAPMASELIRYALENIED